MQIKPPAGALCPKRTKPGFNREVHGARGLFAFLVFVFHVVNSGLPTLPALQTPIADFALRVSEYGVELFFCISGYVIVGTLRRARSPLAFLEDRAIRIYPVLGVSVLAIVALGLATGVHGFADGNGTTIAWMIPVSLLALPGVFPLPDNIHPAAWSLSYEVVFYLACAAFWAVRPAMAARGASRLVMPLAALLGALVLVCYPRAIFFAVGIMVAQGWPRHALLRRATRYPLFFVLLFLLAWELIENLTLPQHIIMTTMLDWVADARLPLAFLAFLSASIGFAGIAAGHGTLGRILRTRPLQYLGTVSYSFYLWHPIVMSGIKTVLLRSGAVPAAGDMAQFLFFAAALPPSLLMAHASERVLERGLAVRLRRWLHHAPPRQPPAKDGSGAPVPGVVPAPTERQPAFATP